MLVSMPVTKKVVGFALVALLMLFAAWGWNKAAAPEAKAPVASVASVASFQGMASQPSTQDDDDDEPSDGEEAAQNLALFFGHDDRVFVPSPYAGAYAAVGKMETDSGSHCTATLIAPDLAVTAAHCFLMLPKKLDKGHWFWVGYHEGKWQARYRVVGLSLHERFRKGLEYYGDDVYIKPAVSAYDIALIKVKLVDGVPPKPMPVFKGNADQLLEKIHAANSEVTQAGYAHDHGEQLTAHIGCDVTGLIADNTLEHQCDTLSGDSGSPLWLQTEQGPQLVAVQSAAPDWFNRDKADNTAVTVLQLPKRPK